MKQLSLFLLFCFFTGSEAWFLDWFKSKKPLAYGGGAYYPPQRPTSYSYYRPQYKVPVWQTLPSGYPARPVQQGASGYADSGYGSYGNGVSGNYAGNAGTSYGTAGYETGGYSGGSYGMPSNAGSGGSNYGTGDYAVQSPNYSPSTGGNNYNNYNDQGGNYAPVYEVTAPVYGGQAGNINVPTTGNTDYTGNKPLLSVPVYFPKGTSGTTYSNGVSGFYDASVEGSSNSIGYVHPSGK